MKRSRAIRRSTTGRQPTAQPYADGWHCNFRCGDHRYRRWFRYDQHPDPRLTCERFISETLAHKGLSTSDVAQSVARYLSWCDQTKAKRPSTIATDRNRLMIFADWCADNGVTSLRDFTVENLRRFQLWFHANHPLYKDGRGRPNASPKATFVRYVMAIRALLNWCVERQIVGSNVVAAAGGEFRTKVRRQIPRRILSPAEIGQLLDYLDSTEAPATACLFRTLVYTGLRLSEALNLTWNRVDLAHGWLTVINSKNDEDRRVPIPASLGDSLRLLQNGSPEGHVFALRDDHCYSKGWLHRILQRALRACKVPFARIHDLRHTYASHLVMSGTDLPTVQRLLGHRSIQTTMIYAHLSESHLAGAIDKLPY